MSESLLACWLAHYDPIHRGWTPAGIANGVCATRGYSFPRVLGGYNLRRRVDEPPTEEDAIVGAAGHDASSVRTFPWIEHVAGAAYVYRLFPIGGGGVENTEAVSTCRAVFDGQGSWPGPQPNRPADVRVEPLAGGLFRISWDHAGLEQEVAPAGFRLYHDSGTGEPDLSEPAMTTPYEAGRRLYAQVSEAFADGQKVRWLVRAVSADGVEDGGGNVVECRARGTGPNGNLRVMIETAAADGAGKE